MIIKKYQAPTEEEAITKAKEDLGQDAVIMNKKSVRYHGFRRLFRKNYCEVTAAVDENTDRTSRKRTGVTETKPVKETGHSVDVVVEDKPESVSQAKGASVAIEERLNDLTHILEQQMRDARGKDEDNKEEAPESKESADSKLVRMVFDKLVENEVTMENAKAIIGEIDANGSKLQLDDLLASVYQKIVLKLGQMKTITPSEDKPKIIYFIGPTGVGKTTTIAKLASKFKLEEKSKLAILTSDTYRIAAVEQIRTYANILSVPVQVIYTADEMKQAIEKYMDYDYIFVDTAGRSHKNEEQQGDVRALLEAGSEFAHEIYLLVSATTKYRDLVKITEVYSDISEYRLLFTKTDETGALGNIINIRMLTGKPLSYTTFGQNVPDDIEVTDAQRIAKLVLGGDD